MSARIADTARIAPSATVSDARIGPYASVDSYARVGSFARIGADASVGSYARIGSYASVGLYARIDSCASVGLYASVGSAAHIGLGAHIGSHARVASGARVGSYARIDSGAYIGSAARITRCTDALHYGPIGSEDRYVTMYRLADGSEALHCGCWTGSLDELSERIEHESAHGWHSAISERCRDEYRALIALCRAHLARHDWSADREQTDAEAGDERMWAEQRAAVEKAKLDRSA